MERVRHLSATIRPVMSHQTMIQILIFGAHVLISLLSWKIRHLERLSLSAQMTEVMNRNNATDLQVSAGASINLAKLLMVNRRLEVSQGAAQVSLIRQIIR